MVSRATAYRYFPTQDALLAEAAASRPVESIDALLQGMPAAPPQARLVRLQAAANRLMLKEEPAMRAALRSYMDAWFEGRARGEARPEVREGRRMRWIATALGTELAALDPARARRLQAALALTLGVEALVVMKDVCRLDDDAACEVLEWAAQALLNASLPGGGK
jgi:AcrR family transcriptional regulator